MKNEKSAPEGVQKNHKKGKVLIWVGGILALFVVAGAITSLRLLNRGDNGEETEDTQVMEEIGEEIGENEGIPELLEEEGDEIDFFLEEVESQFLDWDEMGIPEVYIEYSDGEIGKPDPEFEWQDDGVLNFINIFGSSEKALQDYVDMALTQGWEIESERLTGESEDDSWQISKVEGDTLHTMQLNWHSGESSYLALILSSTSLEE